MALSQVGLIPATSFGPWGLTGSYEKIQVGKFWGEVPIEYQIGLWHCCFSTFLLLTGSIP